MAVLTAGSTWSVTKPITLRDGTAANSVNDFGITDASTFRK
jgi:hypothetical protein